MPLILLGGFYFSNNNWHSDPPTTKECCSAYSEYIRFCLYFNLPHLVLKPTRWSAHSAYILDVILTTSSEFLSSRKYLPGVSDVCIIQCDLHFTIPSFTSSKVIRDYRNAGFAAINNELELFITNYITSFHSPNGSKKLVNIEIKSTITN